MWRAGYCWLKLAVTVTQPDGGPPIKHAGQTIGIYRREGGRWVPARDANLVVCPARSWSGRLPVRVQIVSSERLTSGV